MDNVWAFDPRSGSIQGTYSASIDGDKVVFEFDRSTVGAPIRTADADDGLDAIPKLVNILRPDRQSEAEPGNPVPIAMGGRGGDIPIPDPATTGASFALSSEEKLLKAANLIGPLFGMPTAEDEFPVIRESIESWACAARALSIGVKCKEFVRDGRRSELLDREVMLHYLQAIDVEQGFSYCASVALPVPNRASHRERIALLCGMGEQQERIRLSPERVQPGTSCLASWEVKASFRDGIVLSVSVRSGSLDQPGALFELEGGYIDALYGIDPLAGSPVLTVEQSLFDNLSQAMVTLFVRGVHLDWSRLMEPDGRGACLDLAFESTFQRLWYRFGRGYSVDRIRTCEHCGRLFAAHDGRGKNRCYCSNACQNNAKSARQRKRKAEASRSDAGR